MSGRVLQFVVEGLSRRVVQSSHQQQRSGGVVSNEDDERVISVEHLGLFYVLLIELAFPSLSAQLHAGPLENRAQVEFPLALVRHPREIGRLLVPGVSQAQSRQLFLESKKKKKQHSDGIYGPSWIQFF